MKMRKVDWIEIVLFLLLLGSKDPNRLFVFWSKYFNFYYDYYGLLLALIESVFLINIFYKIKIEYLKENKTENIEDLKEIKIGYYDFAIHKLELYVALIFMNIFFIMMKW